MGGVVDPAERRQRSFLRVSLGVFAALLVAASAATALVISGGLSLRDPAIQATLVGLVVFAYVHHLNEAGHTAAAGRLFVAGVFATVWVFTVQIQGSGYLVGNYAYLVTVVLLASFLVSPLETAAYAGLNLVGIYVLWAAAGLSGTDLVLSLVYQVVFSGMLVLMTAMRRRDAATLRRQTVSLAAANEALRRRNAERGILLEHTGDAVMHLDPDGRLLAGNPAAARWTGGHGGVAWDWLPDPVTRAVRVADGRGVALVLDLDGPVQRVGLRAIPVDEPAPGSLVLFLSDRSDEKQRLEEERRALAATVEVERLRREAQMQRGFLNMVSHELRTPLTPIKLQVSMLRDDPAVPRGSLDVIRRNLERLERLVRDIVDLGRLQDGRMPIRPEPVGAADVVREAVASWRPVAEAKGLRMEEDLEPHTVHADAERLHQVADNLLSNAVKFTPGGRVHVSTRREGDESVLVVEDTGHGFPPEQAERLFSPFERADAERHTVSGVGLGLSICKGIVEAHGGTITARSGGDGRGARFEVRIPLRPPPPSLPSLPPPPPSPPPDGA